MFTIIGDYSRKGQPLPATPSGIRRTVGAVQGRTREQSAYAKKCRGALRTGCRIAADGLRMTLIATDTECERLVADLLAMMSAQEKRGQLVVRQIPPPEDRDALERLRTEIALGAVGGLRGVADRDQADMLQTSAHENSRLGIPLLFFTDTGTGIDTIMPVPLSMVASWDFDGAEVAEAVVSQEAQARGFNWTFSPKVDLVREGNPVTARQSGSDAHLAGAMAAARIRGLEGDPARGSAGLLSCVDLSDALPQEDDSSADDLLRICDHVVRRSRVGAIAYEAASGAQRRTVERAFGFLRGPGGYDGLFLPGASYAARDAEDAAGVWTNGWSTGRKGDLPHDADALDDAVTRVLRAKFRLGLLSAAHVAGRTRPARALPTPVHNREIALDFAKRCAILLRNNPRLLPLGIDSGDVLVVGSAAVDRRAPLAGRSGVAASVIDGLEQLGIPHRFVPGLALREGNGGTDRVIAADDMAIGMACEAAKRAGTVVFVQSGNEERTLGEADARLLSALRAANPNLVFVSLGPAPFDPLVDGRRLPCILHAGQLGTMSGHAVAELLCGEASPSGRLPFALPATDKEPGLPFGHGLTYADFALTDLAVTHGRDSIFVEVDLRNSGEREGLETVQVYLRRMDSEGARLRLVDFQRVRLRPAERETLTFELGRDELGSFGPDGRYSVEAGEFELLVGLSTARGLPARFGLTHASARAIAGRGSAMAAPDVLRRA